MLPYTQENKELYVASAIPCPAISSEGRFVLLYSPTCWSVRKKGSCCFRHKVKFLPTDARYIYLRMNYLASFPGPAQLSIASSTLKWERRKAERGLGTRLGLPQSGLLGYTMPLLCWWLINRCLAPPLGVKLFLNSHKTQNSKASYFRSCS